LLKFIKASIRQVVLFCRDLTTLRLAHRNI
jgi:hypothetical protein